MNKRAAVQYLNNIFGDSEGHVAVAYKDQGQSWQEHQFQWPTQREALLGWAEVHKDANIFICPALRTDSHTRKKGDGKALRWLWADVDWQLVPKDRVQDVKDRISELSTLTVASGSGNNLHVYVKLTREVTREEFIKLNTGLKEYLYADSKQADNSLLRLPGTTNWKTADGSPVRLSAKQGIAASPAALLKRRAFRDAKVVLDADAYDWEYVQVEGLPRRMKALVSMPVAEAEARYGSRYKAVWGVTGELHKRGLGPDEIHSLMDKFPAALDKMAEENGYDPHRDVDKRLLYDRSTEATDPEIDEDAADVFEEASLEDMQAGQIAEGVEKELLRRAVRRAADQAEALRGHAAPPDDTSSSLSDLLSNPPNPTQYLIQDMCSAEGFVVIVGQYKTGKTKLMVNSLLTALADGEPFLGEKEVHVPEGGIVCGHWNLEMSALDLVDKYMRSAQYKNPENVHLANWQGYGVNLLTEPGKQMAIDWLTSRGVEVWSIDSWTALCRSAGVDPNDGGQVGALAQAIIDIKVQAGIKAVFLLAHIARGSQDSERPGTLGSVALDAIVDTRWMMTVDKADTRFIQVEGRGTTMPATSLEFDEETGRSKLGTVGRGSAAAQGWIQTVTSIVNQYPQGIPETLLYQKMCEKGHNKNKAKAVEYIKEAAEAGFIKREQAESLGQGGRRPWIHSPVTKPEGDHTRQATPREVDVSQVRPRGRRQPADV